MDQTPGFLKFSSPQSSEEVRIGMIEKIKENFKDLLTEEDLDLLDRGISGLDKLSEKYHNYLTDRSDTNLLQ